MGMSTPDEKPAEDVHGWDGTTGAVDVARSIDTSLEDTTKALADLVEACEPITKTAVNVLKGLGSVAALVAVGIELFQAGEKSPETVILEAVDRLSGQVDAFERHMTYQFKDLQSALEEYVSKEFADGPASRLELLRDVLRPDVPVADRVRDTLPKEVANDIADLAREGGKYLATLYDDTHGYLPVLVSESERLKKLLVDSLIGYGAVLAHHEGDPEGFRARLADLAEASQRGETPTRPEVGECQGLHARVAAFIELRDWLLTRCVAEQQANIDHLLAHPDAGLPMFRADPTDDLHARAILEGRWAYPEGSDRSAVTVDSADRARWAFGHLGGPVALYASDGDGAAGRRRIARTGDEAVQAFEEIVTDSGEEGCVVRQVVLTFDGLVARWPWLDFVVLTFPATMGLNTLVAAGPVGHSQWTWRESELGPGTHAFVAFTPRASENRSDPLADFRFQWTTRTASGGFTAEPESHTAWDHCVREQRLASGLTRQTGFDDVSRADLEQRLTAFAQHRNAWEIHKRFAGHFCGGWLWPSMAFLAIWSAWSYPLTEQERHRATKDDMWMSHDSEVSANWGQPVARKVHGVATTDDRRVVVWGPRTVRRYQPPYSGAEPQVGVALVLR